MSKHKKPTFLQRLGDLEKDNEVMMHRLKELEKAFVKLVETLEEEKKDNGKI